MKSTVIGMIQQHPASLDAYIRHGWKLIPIPPGTKGPRTRNWQHEKNCLSEKSPLPLGFGIGLAHAYSGTMALDIDDWATASGFLSLYGIDIDALYRAADAVVIHSGNPGHGKLLYAMPDGVRLPSKKISTLVNNKPHNYLDFRCSTSDGLTVQDVLPPSMHPETNQPYRWAGNGNWQRLPTIPDALIQLWEQLLQQDKRRNIPSADGVPASWLEITDALAYIDSNCDRDTWVHVGMALHFAGESMGESDTAFAAWDEWSATSNDKYPGLEQLNGQWRSFKSDKTNVRKIGTLFHYATEAGWTRKFPDATDYFSPVSDTSKPTINETFHIKPPALDMSVFPEFLRRRATEVSESVGCDPVISTFAGLAALSGAADARTRLELVPGFSVPPVLWLMTVGLPGDKKSPGSDPLLQPLQQIERDAIPEFLDRYHKYEALDAQYKAAKNDYLTAAAKGEALLGGDLPPVPPQPDEPQKVRLLISDITSQQMIRYASGNPEGMICNMDEMRDWCRKNTDKNNTENRSCWIAGFESRPYQYDRVNSGEFRCDNLGVTIYGNIQPSVLKEFSKDLSSDGTLQRFIPGPVDSNLVRRGEPVPEFLTNSQEWDQRLRLIRSMPPWTYKFSTAAFNHFRDWQTYYERAKRDERTLGSPPAFQTAFAKLEGTIGRVCLVFHLSENPYELEVPIETLERALKFVMGYVVPALRYTHCDLAGETIEAFLMDYLLYQNSESLVSLNELKRACKKVLARLSNGNVYEQNSTVAGAMAAFEKLNWVARIDDGSHEHQGIGHWAINPNLHDQFSEQRAEREIVKARQSDMNYSGIDGFYTKKKPR